MDMCYEYMVKKKITALAWVKVIGAGILALVLTAAIVLLFFMGINLLGLNLLIILGLWWGFIWIARGMRVEYEYTITNRELDIDVIKGKSRRKHITTINLKNIEFFGNKYDVNMADNLKTMVSKEYYLVGDKSAENIYVTDVISKKDNRKVRVYIQPDEKLLEYIRLANPKVFVATDKKGTV